MVLFSPARRHTLAAALTLVSSAAAFATTRNFTNINGGDWGVGANWTPTGLPGATASDDVLLGNVSMTGVANLTVNITGSESNTNELNSLTLNSHGISGFMIVNQSGATTYINVDTENIGTTTSYNLYNLSAGRNDITTLNIGVSSTNNTYSVSATGDLGVTTALNIGLSGSGSVTQTGGSVEVLGSGAVLTLGVNSGGFGTYSLSSGTLDFYDLVIGKNGSGIFNQTGGTVNLDGYWGIAISSTTGTATYNDSGGTLVNNGGYAVSIGANGTFNLLPGGSFPLTATVSPGGMFNITGGDFGSTGTVDLEGGVLQVGGTSPTLTHFSGGSGIVQNGATSGTLTLNVAPQLIGGNAYPYQFTGTLRDNAPGTMAISLVGGQFALLGTSTYSGPTTLAGTLFAYANNALSPNSTITLLANGTLDAGTFTNSIATLAGTGGTLNLPAGSSITTTSSTNSTSAALFTGNGTFTKGGTGSLFLSNGGSLFTGNILIQGGTLGVTVANGIPVNATVTFGSGGTLAIGTTQNIANFSAGDLDPIVFTNNGSLVLGAGNVDNYIGGNFTGAGSVVKNGAANLTVGYGPYDSVASTDPSVTVYVNSGTLLLNKASGTLAIPGSLVLNGGIALLEASGQITDTAFVNLSGGTLDLNGFNATIGNLYGPSGTIALRSGNLTVSQGSANTYGGAITGTGKFIKTGAGDLTLSGATTFGGTFVAAAGHLILQNGSSAAAFVINPGAFLRFSSTTVNLGSAGIQPAAGGTVEYNNTTINGGFLDGPGTHSFLANTTLSGTTAMSGATISQTGDTSLLNFTNGAAFTSAAPLVWNYGSNGPTGVLNLANSATVSGFSNAGVMTIAANASLTNAGANLILAGGSRTYLGNATNPGGTLTLTSGTTLEVNGALLVNDGTISGTTNVNYAGTAEGIGGYGPVNVSFGGTFQPGFASSGVVNNGATVTQLSGDGTIDNTSTGLMSLTLTGSSTSTFSGPIQNSSGTTSLAIQGTSSLTLLTTPLANGSQSVNTFTGGLSIATGASVTIGATGALPTNSAITNNGALTINANSTASTLSGTGTLSIGPGAALTLATSSGATKQGALILSSTSSLNLSNNFLVIEASTPTIKSNDILQLGAWLQSGNSTGYGITTSPLAPNLAVALIDNASLITPFTTFGGQPTDSNSILIAPELLGDSNIDGHVDLNDLNTVLNHLGTTNAGWTWGGFDGAATIDLNDLNAVLNHLGVSYVSSTTQAAALIPAATPEPASLALLALGGLLIINRRSRQ